MSAVKEALSGFINLFFNFKKFTSHRLLGFSFLVQYVYICFLYLFNYEAFKQSICIITVPLIGCLQAVNATLTFTFLPKKQVDGGYFSYKPGGGKQGTLSYAFIKENIFFAAILAFQWLYFDDRLYPYFKKFWPVEYLFVFLPYVIRTLFPDLFPRTSFRDSMKNQTGEGQTFYYYLTWFTKLFYLWAKHYLGFFLNYYRFLNLATPYDIHCMHLILICSSFATTIAIFLHTLRFKGYINPKTSLVAYVVSYMSTFIGYGFIIHVFPTYPWLCLLCFVGLLINLLDFRAFDVYQIGVLLLLNSVEYRKFIIQ